jgi:hypothetical protein
MCRDPRLQCLYCRRLMRHVRTSGESAEYGCQPCGHRHTVKAGQMDSVFLFFPDDIRAARSRKLTPLFPTTGLR